MRKKKASKGKKVSRSKISVHKRRVGSIKRKKKATKRTTGTGPRMQDSQEIK